MVGLETTITTGEPLKTWHFLLPGGHYTTLYQATSVYIFREDNLNGFFSSEFSFFFYLLHLDHKDAFC